MTEADPFCIGRPPVLNLERPLSALYRLQQRKIIMSRMQKRLRELTNGSISTVVSTLPASTVLVVSTYGTTAVVTSTSVKPASTLTERTTLVSTYQTTQQVTQTQTSIEPGKLSSFGEGSWHITSPMARPDRSHGPLEQPDSFTKASCKAHSPPSMTALTEMLTIRRNYSYGHLDLC